MEIHINFINLNSLFNVQLAICKMILPMAKSLQSCLLLPIAKTNLSKADSYQLPNQSLQKLLTLTNCQSQSFQSWLLPIAKPISPKAACSYQLPNQSLQSCLLLPIAKANLSKAAYSYQLPKPISQKLAINTEGVAWESFRVGGAQTGLAFQSCLQVGMLW